MSSIRLWHHYIGILIAPSVIFFALTGALQIFSLHESHDGYSSPALIQKLSAVHKDQVFALKSHDDHGPQQRGPAAEGSPPPREDHEEGPSTGTVLLKWFFLFVAVALTTSTSFGLWIGLTHPLRRRTSAWLLAAGVVLPFVLYVV